MNLRVDLILETEQRSASVINARSLVRIGAMVGPAIVAVIIAMFVFSFWQVKSNLNRLEGEFTGSQPKMKAAEDLRSRVHQNRAVLKELDGWRKSRVSWHPQFLAIQKLVPADIQFTSLKLEHPVPLTTPARAYILTLEGRATGEEAESRVENLERSIRRGAEFADLLETTTMKGWADTAEGAKETDRLFQIVCTYKPRKFE